MSTQTRLAACLGGMFTISLAVTPTVPLWFTVVCWGITAFLLLWLGAEHFFGPKSPQAVLKRRAAQVAKLNEVRLAGGRLLRRLGTFGPDRDVAEARCAEWVTETKDYLDRELPEYAADFMMDPAPTIASMFSTSMESSWAPKMESRLARLADINDRLIRRFDAAAQKGPP